MKHKEDLPDPKVLIQEYFQKSKLQVYTATDFTNLFRSKRKDWNVHPHINERFLIDTLIESGLIYKVSVHKRGIYLKKGASILSVCCQLYENSCISHGTALFLLGIRSTLPAIIYSTLTQIQPTHPLGAIESRAELTQTDVTAAFDKIARTAPEIINCKQIPVHFVKGRLLQEGDGVIVDVGEEVLLATSLERTLVDIVVRPGYAEGTGAVLEAFSQAIDQTTQDKIWEAFQRQSLIYPYNQAIGFYLQRSGMSFSSLKQWLPKNGDLNFYLDYNMPEKSYDPTWKLYYPTALDNYS